MISMVLPVIAFTTSPGLVALPDGRFSVQGATPRIGIGGFNCAIARIAPMTVAPPVMSYFINSMFSPGFNEMPPESNVTPLPTNASNSPCLPEFRRRVLQNDQLGRLLRTARDAEQRAHAFLFHARFVEHVDTQTKLVRDLARAFGHVGWRHVSAGLVCEIASEVDRLTHDFPRLTPRFECVLSRIFDHNDETVDRLLLFSRRSGTYRDQTAR